MFAEPEKSEETISQYQREVGRLIARCSSESPETDLRELPIIRTARWFLPKQHIQSGTWIAW